MGGPAARAAFGLIVAWLTIRTGGLEAAIALYAAGNVAALLLLTVDGGLPGFLTGAAPDTGVGSAAVGIALVLAVALMLGRAVSPPAQAPRCTPRR